MTLLKLGQILAAWFALLKQDFLAGLVSKKNTKEKTTSVRKCRLLLIFYFLFCLLGGNCTRRDPGVKEEGFINGFG